MKLGSIRKLEEQKAVLKNQGSFGPDPVYWVFDYLSESFWANLTVITSGNYGLEFPKTYGHYHSVNVPETYHLIEGQGILLMQKKHLENGEWIEDMVDEVVLIQAKPGNEVVITPEWGHSWSNIGDLPLLSFDNWREGHSPTDYEVIQKLQGMAYYLVSENGEVKPIKNPNYKNLPEPKWMSADVFKKTYQGS